LTPVKGCRYRYRQRAAGLPAVLRPRYLAIVGLFAANAVGLPDLLMFALAYAWFFLPFDQSTGKAADRRRQQD
jgi:hypothetical protein